MDKQRLTEVKRGFIKNVSLVVIDQLLLDLNDDRVLNDEEKQAILQVNATTRNKACDLIETVIKKGNEASKKMIAHLQEHDPTLFQELGLSPAPAAAASHSQKEETPEKKEEWSTTLIPTTEKFWREKLMDTNVYPVTKHSMRSRVALLITNINFTDRKLNRDGAESDEANTEHLLQSLGYEVVKHTDLTGKEIDAAVREFSAHPKLKDTDSVFVVIMSHGILGAVCGVDWNADADEPDLFYIDNIYKHLNTEKCKALEDKPKVVLIQACRGDEEGSVLVWDGVPNVAGDPRRQAGPSACADGRSVAEDGLRVAHKEKDFISLLSCTPDTVSYRHCHRGAFMIQYTIDVFNTYAHEDHIEELFRKVMKRFEDFKPQTRRQMPTKDRATLANLFYLFPGLFSGR